MQTGSLDARQRRRRTYTILTITLTVAVVVTAAHALAVASKDEYRLEESDGALTFEVNGLPGGFYQPWDNSFVSIYSGEKTVDDHLVSYPIQGGWGPNSSVLMGAGLMAADFGARDIGGSWFNLTVTDIAGDGRIGDGDTLRIHSKNGTFSSDTVYFMEFGASAFGGIAPYYIVFAFEFEEGEFNSWVEWGPNEVAL